MLDNLAQMVGVGDTDGDAAALLTAGGLDDQFADLVEQFDVGVSSNAACRPRGTRSPAPASTRLVTRLSSHMLIATAVVSSDTDSRVMIARPPWE